MEDLFKGLLLKELAAEFGSIMSCLLAFSISCRKSRIRVHLMIGLWWFVANLVPELTLSKSSQCEFQGRYIKGTWELKTKKRDMIREVPLRGGLEKKQKRKLIRKSESSHPL